MLTRMLISLNLVFFMLLLILWVLPWMILAIPAYVLFNVNAEDFFLWPVRCEEVIHDRLLS
jgi:hypothetical protein